MNFSVMGADAASGEDRVVLIEANDRSHATAIARQMGIFASAVHPVSPPPRQAILPQMPKHLKSCPTCNSVIGKGLEVCPRCGTRLRQVNLTRVIVVVIAILFVAYLFGRL